MKFVNDVASTVIRRICEFGELPCAMEDLKRGRHRESYCNN